MNLVPLALIPICSILNHLGGQSTTIPDPRFVARMLGQGLAFGIVAFFSGWPIYQAIEIAVIGIAGFSFWAVWMWGPGFMAINGEDHRDYTKYKPMSKHANGALFT